MPSQRSHLSSMHLTHSFIKYIRHLEGNEGANEGRVAQWSVIPTCRAHETLHGWPGSTPGYGSVIRKTGYPRTTPKATLDGSPEQSLPEASPSALQG